MKKGIHGYKSGCCAGAQVWGVSLSAPGNQLIFGDNTESQAWERYLRNFDYNTASTSSNIHDDEPYAGSYPQTRPQEVYYSYPPPDTTVDKDIVPDLFPKNDGGQQWTMYAAKLPAVYPRPACSNGQSISTGPLPTGGDPTGGDGTWWHTLGWSVEHQVFTDEGLTYSFMGCPRYCYSSRAIYVDGKQVWINYCTSDWVDPNDSQYIYVSRPYDWIGVHSIVPTGECGGEADTIDTHGYRCTTFGGVAMSVVEAAHSDTDFTAAYYYTRNQQERHMLALGNLTLSLGVGDPPYENSYGVTANSPVNCRCFGKQFFIMSSYKPGGTQLGTNAWAVGRIEYQGTRYEPDGTPTTPGIQALCSPASRGDNPSPPYSPGGDVGIDSEGQYAIALPSVRCYIDTSTIDAETHPHDECWVIALRTSGEGPEVITAQWRTPVYRSGYGGTSGDEVYDWAADGTLHADDVAESTTIIDSTGDAGTDFPDETWDDIRIWCYNRVHDYVTGHSRDLALITTGSTEDPTTQTGVIADFEDGAGGYDPQYLNHGIDDYGLAFVTSGIQSGTEWIDDTSNFHGGTNSAYANINAISQDICELRLTFHAMQAGTLSFYYVHDNRGYGTHEPPWGTLTNTPEVDHVLKITINNNLVPMRIITDPDGAPSSEDCATSIIDNVTYPTGNPYSSTAFYTDWRKVEIDIEAGTNTIRFLTNRTWQTNGHLDTWVDDLALPEILVGDDLDSKPRYFFDGDKLYANPYWAWARRDEEGHGGAFGTPEEIWNRVNTTPQFITMDAKGRLLMGNPHYAVRLVRNETGWELDNTFGYGRGDGFTEERGYIRWTASENLGALAPDCEDPDQKYDLSDIIADPPVGVFQILPTSDGGFQTRGCNAAMRDASHYPIDANSYKFIDPRDGNERTEKFKEFLTVKTAYAWGTRPHAWTVSEDGQTRVPHVEVVWRPTRHQMAWPEKLSDCTSPPYRPDFDDSDPSHMTPADCAGNPSETGVVRFRHPFAVDFADREDKTCWTQQNYIVSRTYCDALSRTPQGVWIRVTDDPGVGEGDPNYWEPGVGGLTMPRTDTSPWGSARWSLVQARFSPVQRNVTIYFGVPMYTLDPDTIDVSCDPVYVGGYTVGTYFTPDEVGGAGDFNSFPDFDAVFEVDPTCCPELPPNSGCASC